MDKQIMSSNFSKSSARTAAQQIVDFRDKRRKEILKSFPSDFKLAVVEEMVNIRLERLRGDDGVIRPEKVSEK